MTLTRKNLAFGQLPAVKGNLYVPSAANGLVHNILFHNTGSAKKTFYLYYHNGTNEYKIYEYEMSAYETVTLDFRGEGFIIMNGGKITGNATTAALITYKFDGTEESI